MRYLCLSILLGAVLVITAPPIAAAADPPAAEGSTDPCAPANLSDASTEVKIRCRYKSFFGEAGKDAGLFTEDRIEGAVANPLALRIGVVIRTALSLVGVIFLISTVYSGIQWMIASGNEEKIEKAQTRIKRAVIGLAIVVGSWIMASFIIRSAGGPVRPPDTRTVRPFIR